MSSRPSIFGVLVLVAGCHAPAGAGVQCAEELAATPVTAAARIDVEEIVDGLVMKAGSENYWDSIDPISTYCPVPEDLPDFMPAPPGSRRSSSEMIKPVRRISIPGRVGVVFVYHSVGVQEAATGFAAAFVEYPEKGEAKVYKASELLTDEGWGRLTSSTLTASSTTRCNQELEFFEYSETGDIVGELLTPTRTPLLCKDVPSES